MERRERKESTLIACFYFIKNKLIRFYYYAERLAIMYTPFISSFLYCVHTKMLKSGTQESIYYYYNADICGHSLLWLWLVYIRSKKMCKWYKLSIITSGLSHFSNFLYYMGLFDYDMFLDVILSMFILSMLFWLIFMVTYNTAKKVC